jgi:hypothetical protein
MPGPPLIISENCCIGCGMDVAILRARGSGTLFCYCIGCGCTWLDPAEAVWGVPVNETTDCSDRAPSGVDLADLTDLASGSAWSAAILRRTSCFDWNEAVAELNLLDDGDAPAAG